MTAPNHQQERLRRGRAQKRMEALLVSQNHQAIAEFVEKYHGRLEGLVRKLLRQAQHLTPTVIERAADTHISYLQEMAANPHLRPPHNRKLEARAQKLLRAPSSQLVYLGQQIARALDGKGWSLQEETLRAFAGQPAAGTDDKLPAPALDDLLNIKALPGQLFERLVDRIIENREARQVKELVDHPMTADRPEVLERINQNFSWPSVRERLAQLNRHRPLPESVRQTLLTSTSWKVLVHLRWRASSTEFADIFRRVVPKGPGDHEREERLQQIYVMLRQAQDQQLDGLTAGDMTPLLKHPRKEVREFALRMVGGLEGGRGGRQVSRR